MQTKDFMLKETNHAPGCGHWDGGLAGPMEGASEFCYMVVRVTGLFPGRIVTDLVGHNHYGDREMAVKALLQAQERYDKYGKESVG